MPNNVPDILGSDAPGGLSAPVPARAGTDSLAGAAPDALAERLFLAIELSDEVRAALGALREEYPELRRDLRWVAPEGMHLTLRFLGDATPTQREALIGALGALPDPGPVRLSCVGIGIFGNPSRLRVLWSGLTGDLESLAAVQRAVEGLCVGLGWPPEDRAFKPHVTLARPRGTGAVRDREALRRLLEEYADSPFGEWEAREVVLFRSELGPGGARYTALARRPLAD